MKTETATPVETTPSHARTFESLGEVNEPTPCFIDLKNILVPLDFSETSMKALQYAVAFAQQFNAKVTLLHVAELPAYTPELPCPVPLEPEHSAAITQQLEDIAAERIPAGVSVETAVRHNFAFDGILEVAREIHADLIIASTHGYTGLKHVLMGSTAENIVRKAPCPVLVVREVERDFA